MGVPHIKGKVISGIIWSSVQLVISRGFSFAIRLILAKLLFPSQFGLVGMATVFISFIQIFNEIGIGAALVQRKEEHLTEEHYHTAFWTGLVWSTGIFLLIFFALAPLAADFYDEPMLREIVPVLSLGVIPSAVSLVHSARLTKQMNFKKLAFINNVSTVFAGVVALAMAYMGAGVWALVFNSVAAYFVALPLYFNATKWYPKLIWDKQSFIDIFGFGVYTTGTNFFNNLISQVDYLLIGKLMSAYALGTYTLAFVLTDTFRSQIMGMIGKVMYPVYGQKQDDLVLLKRYYLKVVKYNSVCIYPVMVFFIVLGEPFVYDFFGDKWSDAILPLKILALSVMVHMLVNSHASLIRGLGHSRLEMKIQFSKAVFFYVPLISLGIYLNGIVGAAWAYVLNKALEVVVAQYYLKKLVNVTLKDLAFTMATPVAASTVAFAVTILLYSLNVHYLICAVGLVISYCCVVWFMMRSELNLRLKELKEFKTRRAVPN